MDVVRSWTLLGIRLFALLLGASMLTSAIRHALGPDSLQRWLGGRRRVAGAVKGSALGSITPFCSMSTVPVLTGLLQGRVSPSAVTAFLGASPLIDPMLLVVMGVIFGPTFAIGLAGLAFVGTVLAASAVRGEDLSRCFRLQRLALAPSHSCGSEGAVTSGSAAAGFLPQRSLSVQAPKHRRARVVLKLAARDGWSTARQLWIPLCCGLLVGALISTFAPSGFFIQLFGKGALFAVPLAALLGAPMAINTATALPIAVALLHKGAAPGPVFALIVGGWGASIAEVSLLASLLKGRAIALYLLWVFSAAIAGGYLINVLH